MRRTLVLERGVNSPNARVRSATTSPWARAERLREYLRQGKNETGGTACRRATTATSAAESAVHASVGERFGCARATASEQTDGSRGVRLSRADGGARTGRWIGPDSPLRCPPKTCARTLRIVECVELICAASESLRNDEGQRAGRARQRSTGLEVDAVRWPFLESEVGRSVQRALPSKAEREEAHGARCFWERRHSQAGELTCRERCQRRGAGSGHFTEGLFTPRWARREAEDGLAAPPPSSTWAGARR